MKKLLFVAVLAALAGCAASTRGVRRSARSGRHAAKVVKTVKAEQPAAAPLPVEAAKSVEPVLEHVDDPNPFANYGEAMASDADFPMAVEWQAEHEDEIAAETKPEALVKFLESDQAADDLLAEVKDGYATDPLKETQIAAITQLVMCPKCDKAPAWRIRWTRALVKAAMDSNSVYRTGFFLDQLRWCGSADDVQDVLAIAGATGEKATADFAVMVAAELKTAR